MLSAAAAIVALGQLHTNHSCVSTLIVLNARGAKAKESWYHRSGQRLSSEKKKKSCYLKDYSEKDMSVPCQCYINQMP